ncbi:YeaH/YhbH family protein [Rhodoferax sp. AJA081-3]|uniref:YeaH/YhbH family protein n=1 Tax=Rhodoferax sp. AJA081-3 TaxID=2752316 RepID=UPI001ADFE9F3|nr:YeaH/YhbH family protein [Rhodoferax sp. AJA081-3]QTN29109.1 YeaH/YhbH family protein [Rhodoferax sp. AJA081-3]
MPLQIIDRRLSGKNKSIGNRERFLRRYKEQIGDAVRRAVSGRGIRDMEQAEDITIPRKDISEPVFHHGQGGIRDTVHPGNKDYVRGDRIARPKGGGGGRGGQASDSGEGEDDFTFTLSKEEFMQIFFEDLALPHLLRTQIGDSPEWKSHRAGYSHDGTPNNLHIVRSMRGALGRRIALGTSARRELHEKEALLAEFKRFPAGRESEILALERDILELRRRLKNIPFLDPIDLCFRNRVKVPVPTSKAVMFCLMDVSGSMDQERKDLSKRFFTLLYLFLTRHYDKIDIVFIRHHTQAQEVDEDTFFHATESGGTVVSSALVLMHQIIAARYPHGDWNIYGAQASDGDNFSDDSERCTELLTDKLLPLCRYFAYVQVADEEQNLWREYVGLQAQHSNFAMRKVTEASQIYPVFRDLFKKEGANT